MTIRPRQVAGAAQGQRPEAGAVQPAGGRLGRRRARHRLPARPGRGIPRAASIPPSPMPRRSIARRSIASPVSRPRALRADGAGRRRWSTTSNMPRRGSPTPASSCCSSRSTCAIFRASSSRHTDHAERILDAVGSDNLFIQYDIYHTQVMQGDLMPDLSSGCKGRIAHVQIADNPGRNEPGTGEINYAIRARRRSTGLAMTAGSAANTSPRPAPAAGLGWMTTLSLRETQHEDRFYRAGRHGAPDGGASDRRRPRAVAEPGQAGLAGSGRARAARPSTAPRRWPKAPMSSS